jgi:hypothetical protein
VALDRRGRDVDADQAVAQPGGHPVAPAIAVTTLPNGKTRMYVHEGNNGTNASRAVRSDDVATGAPVFTRL